MPKGQRKSVNRNGAVRAGTGDVTLKVVDRHQNTAVLQQVGADGSVTEWHLIVKNNDTFTFGNPQTIKQGVPGRDSRINGSAKIAA